MSLLRFEPHTSRTWSRKVNYMAVTLYDTCHSRYVRVSSFLLFVFQSLFWFHPLYMAFQYCVWSSTQRWQPNQFDYVYNYLTTFSNSYSVGLLDDKLAWMSKGSWLNQSYILLIVQRDATQSSLFNILQVHSTCFRCQPHPSSGVHKTVTTASGTGHIFCAATSLRGQATTSTRGCSYSFVYSRWWV